MVQNPAYVRNFRKYISTTRGVDQERLEREFYGESDRACCILQASWIELALEDALKASIQPRSSKIFAYPAPLSTFSAKVDFGYEVKLFGPKTKHDLDLVRELRNGFAHSMVPIQFSDPETSDICDHFQIISTSSKTIPLNIFDQENNFDAPRNKFLIVCYSIVAGLLSYGWALRNPTGLPPSGLP